MIIYIDGDFKCHVSAAEGRRAIGTGFFDGKCPEWIESYRFVPEGGTRSTSVTTRSWRRN